jgi:hypothetical protein
MWLFWLLGLCVLVGIVTVIWAHFAPPGDPRGNRALGIAAILLLLPTFVIGAGDLFGLIAGNIDMLWPDLVMILGGGSALADALFRAIRRR